MTPSPIRKVLFTFRRHRVRALLMGGQACILYGAAEFSRDTDFVVLCDAQNLRRLRAALRELNAQPVFVPPLDEKHLLRGHACHFRCRARGVEGLRVDIMSVMRGCEPFTSLWARRKQIRLPGLGAINVLSLADLVQAKKTQRDKDWPMIRRLVEADYSSKRGHPKPSDLVFWFREMRSAELLIELAHRYPQRAIQISKTRPLMRHAIRGRARQLNTALEREQSRERDADRAYWLPLRRELAEFRRDVVRI